MKEEVKMGVWMTGTGNISIRPQVDENLIKEYMHFSKSCFPEEYGEECFANTWFFDEENKLFSIAGKNALDFYIAVECGVLGSRGENQISIISKDKGFGAVSDFFRIQEELGGVTVRVASNIENALVALNAPEDEVRKLLIKEKTRTLSIDAEQARIMEHRAFIEKITQAFEGTEYEDKTEKIIRFIESRDEKTLRLLYTGSMHEFGREDGRAIYQVLKQVV